MYYGVDVAIRRADDLDKMMMDEVTARTARGETPTVLDLGSGAFGLSGRLATLGAHVTAVDIHDYSADVQALQAQLQAQNRSGTITFTQGDLVTWLHADGARVFDYVVLQRVLHYLPYHEAVAVLTHLGAKTSGRLYLSLTGVTSAIAQGYPALTEPITKRFGTLTPDVQDTFSITAPLCLYAESEARALLHDAGWHIEWLRVSDFGNIKVVARSFIQ